MLYELQTEIYMHPLDQNTPANLDKFRGKMRICRDSSYVMKEPREGGGCWDSFTYELPSAIYIYQLHPNTNVNFDIFTKKWRFEGIVRK